jgi:hypothetical protein
MTASMTGEVATAIEAAIVWIDRAHAQTIRIEAGGRITIEAVAVPGPMPSDAENLALVRVVEAIGDAPRVLLLGDREMRLALDREYVALRHQPERLVDVD